MKQALITLAFILIPSIAAAAFVRRKNTPIIGQGTGNFPSGTNGNDSSGGSGSNGSSTLIPNQINVWKDAVSILGAVSFISQDSISYIYNNWLNLGDGDNRKLAYILATAWHESRLGELMSELSSGEQYEGRSDLGNIYPGDGPKFKGGGLVQITGRANYAKYSDITGIDLISNPQRVQEIDIAAFIMIHGMMKGSFTGVSLENYINQIDEDYFNARRVVNGTDKAQKIANEAKILIDYFNQQII